MNYVFAKVPPMEWMKRPGLRDLAVSVATLAAGMVALVGADYGMPTWFQVPLYLWLLTVGLPTTVTVLCLATLWGRFEPFYGISLFKIMVCLLAPVVHVFVMANLRRWTRANQRTDETQSPKRPEAITLKEAQTSQPR
jgi:hypothetical protein